MLNGSYAQFRLNEARRPSLSPVLRGLGQTAAGPIFRDVSGNVITSIQCGQAYTFEVPGYTEVLLQLIKDGTVTFNQPFTVPMPPYASVCGTDPGHYEVIVSDLQTMQEIGRTTFDILGGGGLSSIFSGLTMNEWLMIGGVALLLLGRKKKA